MKTTPGIHGSNFATRRVEIKIFMCRGLRLLVTRLTVVPNTGATLRVGDKKLIVQRALVGAKSGLVLTPEPACAAAAAIVEIPKPILPAGEIQN